jgi:hypothetical protein
VGNSSLGVNTPPSSGNVYFANGQTDRILVPFIVPWQTRYISQIYWSPRLYVPSRFHGQGGLQYNFWPIFPDLCSQAFVIGVQRINVMKVNCAWNRTAICTQNRSRVDDNRMPPDRDSRKNQLAGATKHVFSNRYLSAASQLSVHRMNWWMPPGQIVNDTNIQCGMSAIRQKH